MGEAIAIAYDERAKGILLIKCLGTCFLGKAIGNQGASFGIGQVTSLLMMNLKKDADVVAGDGN
jgi:hypothetical protein